MERPYVICHILSSLDGKITGPFMGTEAAGALGAEYGRYRTEMNARALLYGTTTTKEFTSFRKPVLEETEEVPEGDFVADDRQTCILFQWMWTVKSDGNRGYFAIKGERRLM